MMSNLVFSPPPSPPATPLPPEASLSTQERLRLARRRRAAQLKRWAQRERKITAPDVVQDVQEDDGQRLKKRKKKKRMITFVPNVMLLEAAARNDVQEVRRLLELGVSPDSTNEDGLTALHQCCIDDSEEMMKLLLDFGANSNAVDTERWTPLHAAATCGHLHLVKFLIDHGADLLAVNADGNMPYDLCEDDTTLSYIENEMARRGVTQELIDDTRAETEKKMFKDLQRVSTDLLEARDAHGATPLHIASANGYLSVVEFLLDNHVSTECVDNDQWQPIHAAACWGHLEVVEILAQNGANISARTKNGETPFDICEDPEIKERLIQLREQKVRLEKPGPRRSRSASTRTQSIRRTSLREKMNTTKKDVQEEKMYYIQSFDALPNGDTKSKSSSSNNSRRLPSENNPDLDVDDEFDIDDIDQGRNQKQPPTVDVKDVELTLLPSYVGKDDDEDTPPPPRPPRNGLLPLVSVSSPSSDLPSNVGSNGKPINITVSVTINHPNANSTNANSVMNSSSSPNTSYTGSTLSDLKKARSMSRVIPSSNPVLSPSSVPKPKPELPEDPPEVPSNNGRKTSQKKKKMDSENVQKFLSTETDEVVGPPKKTGCCKVM